MLSKPVIKYAILVIYFAYQRRLVAIKSRTYRIIVKEILSLVPDFSLGDCKRITQVDPWIVKWALLTREYQMLSVTGMPSLT